VGQPAPSAPRTQGARKLCARGRGSAHLQTFNKTSYLRQKGSEKQNKSWLTHKFIEKQKQTDCQLCVNGKATTTREYKSWAPTTFIFAAQPLFWCVKLRRNFYFCGVKEKLGGENKSWRAPTFIFVFDAPEFGSQLFFVFRYISESANFYFGFRCFPASASLFFC
jgi:hypothetical protein